RLTPNQAKAQMTTGRVLQCKRCRPATSRSGQREIQGYARNTIHISTKYTGELNCSGTLNPVNSAVRNSRLPSNVGLRKNTHASATYISVNTLANSGARRDSASRPNTQSPQFKTTIPTPWTAPHTRKLALAPCHSPESTIASIKLI